MKKTVSPEYDDTDIETLKKIYTPEQLEAILLGEKTTPSKDLAIQGRIRTDPYRFRHLEDFATIRPVVDKRPKSGRPVDPTARFMTPDEFGDDLLDHYREGSGEEEKPFGVDVEQALSMYEDMRSRLLNKPRGEDLTEGELLQSLDKVLGPVSPESVDVNKAIEDLKDTKEQEEVELSEEEQAKARDEDLEFYKYMMERNSMTGFDGGDTALAPDLPDKVPGVAGLYKQQMSQEEEDLDPEGKFQELKRQTGMSIKKIIEIYSRQTKVLVVRYVSNQTRLGKIRSVYHLVVAGNNDGWIGLGEAKSVDHGVSEAKAKLLAIRNMRPIRRYENRTIYGNVEGKSGATVVQLFTRPPGTHLFFRSTALSSPNFGDYLLTVWYRIRPPRVAPNLRDGPSRRSSRLVGEDAPLAQSLELGQGLLPGFDQPARSGGVGHWSRQEARRCAKGLLRWCHTLDSVVGVQKLCIIINHPRQGHRACAHVFGILPRLAQ